MGLPYVRLSGFYFFYFALLGALVPYWSLYLKSYGFGAETIGILMGLLHGTRIVAPNIWGWLADRTGQRLRIVQMGSLVTCLVFVLIFWQEDALGIGLVMLGFSFFWNAVLPQFEVITLGHLGEERDRYSRIRLWGSIGFIAAVLLVGWLFDWVSVRWLPAIMLAIMVMIWLNALFVPVPEQEAVQRDNGDGFITLLLRPQVVAFFAICFLVQFSHGVYYTFYSVLMESVGYARREIGILWSIGVVAEVVIFVFMHSLIQRFGLRIIMIVSLMLCVLRWLMIGIWPDHLVLMLAAQTLHAATFGTLHAVGIALVHHYFNDRTHGQGQALFSSFGFGAGGALGAVVSGFLWEEIGSTSTFAISAFAAAIAIVLAWVWIRPEKVQQSP
ncbi:MFS transporter [Pontibacterium granulatum]|uniref:MFS transporter n=1 Tax=Pontibacterium granulatum TaxID=2036029 RepID=UPI002499B7C1|nr:MFS transporter [Pontibacterium granulatum]MDI3324990.1 MFS transporter [Pontibacterium granulatum]